MKQEKYKEIILEQLREQIKKNQLIVYAYCVMDNHIHIIWQVKGIIDTSEVQKQFLEGCSKHIKADLELYHPNVLPFFKSSQKDRQYHFWKRCAKSKEFYDDAIFEQKLDYSAAADIIIQLKQDFATCPKNIYIQVQDIMKWVLNFEKEYSLITEDRAVGCWPLAQQQVGAWLGDRLISPTGRGKALLIYLKINF